MGSAMAGKDRSRTLTRLTRHLDAGADHVCLHLITEAGTDPLPGYHALAQALGLS